MQTVTTLPILQTVNDSTTHYVSLQPAISGRTSAEYVNRNISFNPSTNTLNIVADVIVNRTMRGKNFIFLDAKNAYMTFNVACNSIDFVIE